MGEKWKQWQILFSWAPKSLQKLTTVMKLKGTSSLEEKLWQECIKKQIYHFANKGTYTLFFPVVMYGCEGWTIKKAEHRRIDAFKLWCLRRLLRVPWTARRSNQLILKKMNPEYSLDWCWSSKTLVTWCEELIHWRRPWWWERLKAKAGDSRGWDS